MSEREFDLYLSLLAKFLKLRPGQREEIADELRDHLEQRLEELSARGMTRDAAIYAALEEFGDAAELANHFTSISRIRRRRLIMRTTAGTVAALVVVLLLTNAFWPNMPAAPAPARVIAQQSAGADNDQKPLALPVDAKLDLRAAVEHKLSGTLDKVEFSETPLDDALHFLADAANVDILIDESSLNDEGVARDELVTLHITRTRVTIRTALELMLEPLQLTYRIRDGLIQVITSVRAGEQNEVVVYNVRDLMIDRKIIVGSTVKSSGSGFFQLGGAAAEKSAEASPMSYPQSSLLDVITTAIEPDSWDTVGGAGTVCEYDGLLVVRNSQAVHEKVRQLLEQLRVAAKETAR